MRLSDSRKTEILEALLQALPLEGRDYFHTHLIQQEIPFWLKDIWSGAQVDMEEVRTLIRSRGFNKTEARNMRGLARWLNDNATRIRRLETVTHQVSRIMSGFEDGVRGGRFEGYRGHRKDPEDADPLYTRGYRLGTRTKNKVARKLTEELQGGR